MKRKILITFGTRPLAQRLAKLLKNGFDFIFASSDDLPHVLLEKGNYYKIPTGINPVFVHEVLKIAIDQQVDFVLPVGAMELSALSGAKTLFSEYDIDLLVPGKAALEEMPLIENPPSALALTLMSADEVLLGEQLHDHQHRHLEGLFIASDDHEEWAIACVNG